MSEFVKRTIFGVLVKNRHTHMSPKFHQAIFKTAVLRVATRFSVQIFLFDQYMSGLAETIVLVSAEGFFLGPAEGFRAEIAKFTI